MKTFLIITLFPFAAFAENFLNCSFGMFNVAILSTKTQLTEDLQIGKTTWANYQASPPKEIFNAVLKPQEKELYRFQLEEGFGEKNIHIIVSQEKMTSGAYSAYALNPQMPMMDKMTGTCEIQ